MLLNDLLTAQEEAVTLNGATTNATSGSRCLDFFSQGGAMRNRTEFFIKGQFEKAWEENPQQALKILGWIYDCRGGCGERDVFYHCFMWLIEKKPEVALWVIHQNLIPEYGRWDMLIRILNSSCPEAIEKAILEVIAIQLNKDSEGKQVTLCGKWMPREDKKYGKVAKKIRKFMGLSAKTYRKLLVKLTNVVEQQMCSQQWQEINYSQVPSRASLIYRNAFNRHDSERYVKFLQEVEKGKTKINANQLYPYDLVQKYCHNSSLGKDETIELQWKSLPNPFEQTDLRAVVPVVDVSRSMFVRGKGQPFEISVSLGLFLAERNPSIWGDYVISFHTQPNLIRIQGDSLYEKVQKLINIPWGGSTNIQAVFDLILEKAVEKEIPQAELPEMVLIISDMEFNAADQGVNTNFEVIASKFAEKGYTHPTLVFWNVDAKTAQFPVVKSDPNTVLISGFSPEIFSSLTSGKSLNPETILLQTIEADRYLPWGCPFC